MSANSIIDSKRFSGITQDIVNATLLKKHGVECFFERAFEAIGFGTTRSEILIALKKDITKSAEILEKVQHLAYSIENGVVKEFDSVFNKTEEVFGKAFDEQMQTVTLSGVVFNLRDKTIFNKATLAEKIYFNIFGVDKKELDTTVKAITVYDSEDSPLKKAILSPSLASADKIIQQVVGYDLAFANFRKGQSYQDKVEFDISFKRTGVYGVIQNSTYIDKEGTRQTHKAHRPEEVEVLSQMVKEGLKYVEAVEIDGDGDVAKATEIIRQIECLKINSKEKFTLKFRKLGNHNALGLCSPTHNIVAEDVREMSAIIHELAHHIHLHDLKENEFVNNVIKVLMERVDFSNASEEIIKKRGYYLNPDEVVARALEIAALLHKEEGLIFEEDGDFSLVKQRSAYKRNEGIYFNFTAFSKEEVKMMKALFKLFFQTTPGEVFESGIDNFVKIDTAFSKSETIDIDTILKRADKIDEKERRDLFSMVRYTNIETIIANKGQISLEEMATTIFANIRFCGNHGRKMPVEEWAILLEDKASTVLYLFDALAKELTCKKSSLLYFNRIKKLGIIKRIGEGVLLGSFSIANKLKIRKVIEKNTSPSFSRLNPLVKEMLGVHPILMFKGEDLSKDKELLAQAVEESPDVLKYLDQFGCSTDEILEYSKVYWAKTMPVYTLIVVPSVLSKNEKAMLDFIRLAKPISIESYVSIELRNSASFMREAIALGVDFKVCGQKLLSDLEFCKPYIKETKPLLLINPNEKKKSNKAPAKIKKPKSEETKAENASDKTFEELLKEAEFFDFNDTRNGESKKGMRLKCTLSKERFREFLQYLRDNDIVTGYSSFIKGFIIKNIEKAMTIAAASTLVLYSQETLQIFATGKLF